MALSMLIPQPVDALEAWTSYEVRVPFDDTASLWPHWVRIANDFRYGPDYPGIGQALLRVGPIWEPHPALSLATHFTSSVEQGDPGRFSQEFRAELEPTLRWRWGNVQGNDRVRIERRMFPESARWRVRNRLQFSYQPAAWSWVPFVSEEAFWEDGVYNQNRFSVGASLPSGPHARLTLGYMLRTKGSGPSWDQTHALTFGFTFSPVIDPLFDDGPSR
jgi:hypothetical protein